MRDSRIRLWLWQTYFAVTHTKPLQSRNLPHPASISWCKHRAIILTVWGSFLADYIFALRWKSQRSKIHKLAYRFSIDFSVLGLVYGFLSKVLDFFLAITNIWQKSCGLKNFKNPLAGLDFCLFWIYFITLWNITLINSSINKVKRIVLHIKKGRKVDYLHPPLSQPWERERNL